MYKENNKKVNQLGKNQVGSDSVFSEGWIRLFLKGRIQIRVFFLESRIRVRSTRIRNTDKSSISDLVCPLTVDSPGSLGCIFNVSGNTVSQIRKFLRQHNCFYEPLFQSVLWHPRPKYKHMQTNSFLIQQVLVSPRTLRLPPFRKHQPGQLVV